MKKASFFKSVARTNHILNTTKSPR